MEGRYSVIEIKNHNESLWQDLLNVSDKYDTPFIRDDFLNIVGFNVKKFVVSEKSIPVGGLCLPIRNGHDWGGIESCIVPFAPYQGFIFRNDLNSYQEVIWEILNYLKMLGCNELHFSNLYHVRDFTALCDKNLELKKGTNINIRYTAIKYLRKYDELSRLRKREIKKGKLLGLQIRQSSDINSFLYLYDLTFKRQGINLEDKELILVKKLTEHCINNGYGELWDAKNKDGKTIHSRVILKGKRGYAYDLFAGNHPNYRGLGGATSLLLKIWNKLINEGYEYFDFLGCNSPQRGDYKLSFESELVPYYLVNIINI